MGDKLLKGEEKTPKTDPVRRIGRPPGSKNKIKRKPAAKKKT